MRATFRAASEDDAELLLPMMQALWEHEGVPFEVAEVRGALRVLLASPQLGHVWIALDGDAVAGYAMGTWGFSTEQGGRFLLLDELLILPEFQGRGLGRAALEFVEEEARRNGAGAVRLEVAAGNGRARDLYRAAGYADPGRHFLAKRLGARA